MTLTTLAQGDANLSWRRNPTGVFRLSYCHGMIKRRQHGKTQFNGHLIVKRNEEVDYESPRTIQLGPSSLLKDYSTRF